MKNNIIIFGASSSIANELIKLYALDKKYKIFTFSKNIINQKASNIYSYKINYNDEGFTRIKEILKNISPSIVFFSNGFLSNNHNHIDKIISINSVIPIKLTNLVLELNLIRCKFIFFGSPASERGRKSNFLYGSAKSLLKKYCEGLRHKYHLINPHLEFYYLIIQPTATKMTSGIDNLKLDDKKKVAKQIIKFIKQKKYTGYLNFKWRFIMFVIKKIPDFLFNKIDI